MPTTDANTKLRLIDPRPSGFKPGDNWAPLALVDGKLRVRGQKELTVLHPRSNTGTHADTAYCKNAPYQFRRHATLRP